MFAKLARDDGVRRFVHERCDNCSCETADGDPAAVLQALEEVEHEADRAGVAVLYYERRGFNADAGCPYGHNGRWEGPSGWRYALECTGLAPLTGRDFAAAASGSGAFGRNRQMVTAGGYDVKKQILIGVPSTEGR